MQHIVTAPLVIAKSDDERDLYVYKNSPVPPGQSEDWLKRHLDEKMIAECDDLPLEDEPVDGDARPSRNASKDDWLGFARGQGMTDEELEGKSRNEIRDLFDDAS